MISRSMREQIDFSTAARNTGDRGQIAPARQPRRVELVNAIVPSHGQADT